MTGAWPPEYVDHKDGDPSNNRWENLRPASAQENSRNKKRKYNSFTGIKGVKKNSLNDTWEVQIDIGDRILQCGPYFSYQKACQVYDELAEKYFGEFHKPEPPRQQRANFKREDVNKAVEDFIKNKTLVNGVYV